MNETQAWQPQPPELEQAFRHVREASRLYCKPLQTEDYGLQALPETSPPKWHLAHTSWFFETFLLKPFLGGYQAYQPDFEYLFNSYYNGVGAQFPRPQRGLLSRPTVAEVYEYRAHVDSAMMQLLAAPGRHADDIMSRTVLGLHHELQHQELFFTDLKYSLSCNPLKPVYLATTAAWSQQDIPARHWISFPGGKVQIGASPSPGFCFDNETPSHTVWLAPYQLSSTLVTNGEFLAFMEDGGYREASLWLADGWAQVRQAQWQQPLYWQQRDGQWYEFTLHGEQRLDPLRPVCHLSAYEADAFARWAGARLPTEFEWENAARGRTPQGHFVERGHYHPTSGADGPLHDLFGSVWEWTSSAYAPYPGYRPAAGAIGEYNGKFMCNQLVLRGGSCVSDRMQLRSSYRNFFYPADRWQFSGLRLARDGSDHD